MSISRRSFTASAGWSVPAVLVAVAAPAVAASTPVAGWRQLGTHPQAAAQPTTNGQRILDLEILHGRLYAGFGDYGENTGPIGINPFDIAQGAFLGVQHQAYTHQIAVWRFASYGLVAPNIDPLQDVPDDANDPRAGMSWTADGLTWNQQVIGPAFHVFDFTESSSGRWIVGSSRANGNGAPTIWRRGGAGSWQVSFIGDDDPSAGTDRYYWIAAVDGIPYVQGRGPNVQPPMRSFDPETGSWWSVGLTTEFHQSGMPQHVQVLGSSIISASGPGLRFYNTVSGTLRQVMLPGGERARDIYVRDEALYLLTDSMIYRTLDGGGQFDRLAEPPQRSTALAVGDGAIYVGTADAQLWARDA